MVNLNGSAPKINIGLSLGVLSLLVFAIAVGGFYIQETKTNAENAKIQSQQNNKDIQEFQYKSQKFINDWNERAQLDNDFNNKTLSNLQNISSISNEQETQLLNIAKNQTDILNKQIGNEKNIIGNLSSHRIIANLTYKEILENQKQLDQLIKNSTSSLNKTNQLIMFLTDNFGENSGYLEKENFQYKQSNDTAGLTKENNALIKQLAAALNITNTNAVENQKNNTINDKTVQQILEILNKTQ